MHRILHLTAVLAEEEPTRYFGSARCTCGWSIDRPTSNAGSALAEVVSAFWIHKWGNPPEFGMRARA